jgi:hypothetical protein
MLGIDREIISLGRGFFLALGPASPLCGGDLRAAGGAQFTTLSGLCCKLCRIEAGRFAARGSRGGSAWFALEAAGEPLLSGNPAVLLFNLLGAVVFQRYRSWNIIFQEVSTRPDYWSVAYTLTIDE